MSKTNKRTLKKRIRRVISFTIFITLLLFSSIIMFFAAQVFKTEAVFVSDYVSKSTASNINSKAFRLQMGITGLEDFNKNTAGAYEWIQQLRKNEDSIFSMEDTSQHQNPAVPDSVKKHLAFEMPGMKNMIETTIEINGITVYESTSAGNPNELEAPFSKTLLNFFSNAEASSPLFNSRGDVIGNVTTRFNSEFLVYVYLAIAVAIIILALISLFIANIIGKFFSMSITTPLSNLDKKITAIASEDFGSGVERQIVLKKPLREIESLANATNQIMHKMQEYNYLLEEQKVTLENQNEELEAQNEELVESKRKIEEAQAMLVQSESMASIGQLTAAITHEINTPLGAIQSNAQMYDMLLKQFEACESIQSSEECTELLSNMKETNAVSLMACQRVIEIIKSLKTFSKLDQAEFQEANINEGIRSVLVLTSNLWKKKITIHEDYGGLPMVKCFSGLMNQVFMNIIVNAIQAIESKGDIFIKTYADESNVYISIRDTGIGIREDILPRIFESGFSTKSPGVGSGLGLSICRNIIQKHKGQIHVQSEVGKGTEFIVFIPIKG